MNLPSSGNHNNVKDSRYEVRPGYLVLRCRQSKKSARFCLAYDVYSSRDNISLHLLFMSTLEATRNKISLTLRAFLRYSADV